MSSFFITCAQGLAPFVVDELHPFGINGSIKGSGVYFEGTIEQAYQACLWSRCASKVLLQLAHGRFTDLDQLYEELITVPWSSHLDEKHTFAVHVTAPQHPQLNTHFAALRVKDSIVDYFYTLMDKRPDVAKHQPDLRFYVHLSQDYYTLYLDFSGESLHKRGFRIESGIAPLKETLAAALLYKLNWPDKARQHQDFLDPLCGAGTILIEAAMMARDVAPAIARQQFGFMHWRQHDAAVWEKCLEAAKVRAREGVTHYRGRLLGVESVAKTFQLAKANMQRADMMDNTLFYHQSFQDFKKPADFHGLIITNPPYGERLGDEEGLKVLYAELGDWLKANFLGQIVGIITAHAALGKCMGLKAKKVNKFYNGALECLYLQFDIEEKYFVNRERLAERQIANDLAYILCDGGEDFRNRLLKNRKKWEKWSLQKKIECYRIYNADLPDFNLAVDRYHNALVVQEFSAPKSIDAEKAKQRLEKALHIIEMVFSDISSERIFFKKRERQRGQKQYEKLHAEAAYFQVREGKAYFWVNLSDYLDTGLFLDHRNVRLMIAQMVQDKHFLNLFAYTGTASIHAALGGAKTTTTVDMSKTYLQWAQDNFTLNQLSTGNTHQLIQANAIQWLTDQVELLKTGPLMKRKDHRYDVIFMDPPSFSNSKRMEGILDLQRDHSVLIKDAMYLLDHEGTLIFSTNLRKFMLDEALSEYFDIEDITLPSLPEDFARDPKIRQCYLFHHKDDA